MGRAEYGADAGDPDFNMVISGRTLNIPYLIGERLSTESICLAVSANSALATREKIDISELKNESFVSMGSKSDLYLLTEKICADFGFEPRVVIQGNDPFYVRKCVEMGLGISFVPSLSWKGQFSNKVMLKELEGYMRDIFVWRSAKKFNSKYTDKLLELLVEEFENEAK